MILWQILQAQRLGRSKDALACLAAERLNGGRTHTLEGLPPLTFASSGRPLTGWSIMGLTYQASTPTPDSPVPVQGVGDLVASGEHAGQYLIPVTVSGGGQSVTTSIYLDSPLMQGEVLRSDGSRAVRWGWVTFSGTESWELGDRAYRTLVLGAQSVPMDVVTIAKSTHFAAASYEEVYSRGAVAFAQRSSSTGTTNGFAFSLGEATGALNVASWSAKLAASPVTVCYPVAASSTQTVTLPQIQTVRSSAATLSVGTQVQPADVMIMYS